MPKLKLPRRPREGVHELPPALRWDAPHATAALLLSRRQFLRAVAVLLAAAALPLTHARRTWAAAHGRFLTRAERDTVAALADMILPPDQHAGGAALGVAEYVDGLLTAFARGRRPRVYAGGPFSGRNPFPDNRRGVPSKRRPRNAFKHFLPLSRLQELRWRAELYGSAAVPGADFNDAALGAPLVGLRDVYRAGLARVDELAQQLEGDRFARLAPDARARVFATFSADGAFPPDARRGSTFFDVILEHTIEGAFSPPEYGGNRRLAGWEMLGIEGDNQPLGFSIYSTDRGGYLERPDHPMSTPDPGDLAADGSLAPRGLSSDAETMQRNIVTLTAFLPTDC
jgi:hypothetical protein